MTRFHSIFFAGALLSLLACSGSAELITIYAVPNKTVIGFGEELQLDLYAKLDPGIGGEVLWYPPNGDPPKLGIVAALGKVGFDMRIRGITGSCG